MCAQQRLNPDVFRQLTTTDQRIAFLADSNVAKMDKPTFEAILTIIEAKKDDKATFYWHYQYMRFAEQFKVFKQRNVSNNLRKYVKSGI